MKQTTANEKTPQVFRRLTMYLLTFLTAALFLVSPPTTHAKTHAKIPNQRAIDSDLFQRFPYRHIGPQGNRIIAVAGVPGDINVYFVGAASGGLWKSTDGGIHWKPVFDDQPAQSVSAVAIAPSDTNVVWAGTGETFIRSNVSIGNGIYKSTDGGETFTHMGLDQSGRIGRIIIHPQNPDIVFAAAMGHCYGPQQERGVYRTRDGGKTWERILFVNPDTGCSELCMDPTNPRVLFAGLWQVEIKTWGRKSGGPGSGLFVSRDGGDTWKRLEGNGLPSPPLGKIAVEVARSNPNRVYALIETGNRGSLWRSDDGGHHWQSVSRSRLLNERPHYYTRMAVSPTDHNEVYFPSNSMSVTLDGGETTRLINWGGDNHDMWIDPLNPHRMMIGNDGGVMITTNHGNGWNDVPLPVAQMYHVAVDNRVPYNVYGNRQDGLSYRGPSNSRFRGWFGDIPSGMWRNVAGCECGFTYPDPVDDHIIWGGCYNAGLDRFDLRTGHNRSVRVWPKSPMGSPAGQLKYRFNWTFPIAISPHDHNRVYVGSQHVHMTTNGGQSWNVISPDLSTNNPDMLGDSGGLTRDNLGVEYGCLVFAIAESPLEAGVIWAGTNDGLLHLTRDNGTHWENLTPNIRGLPPLGTISNIEPSRHHAGTCYISVDLHQVNNRDPHIYKTTNHGKTWRRITNGIPHSVFSYVHCVREDPVKPGLLFAGTENGLYVSFDDGGQWMPLRNNLPQAPVHWLVVQEHFADLVVATYGRGFWIMDDITPLRQLQPGKMDNGKTDNRVHLKDTHLFSPRPAYRFREVTGFVGYPNDQVVGKNPPYGASINYYLANAAEKGVSLVITDDRDRVIRRLDAPGKAGINRIYWDLRHEPPHRAELRTRPTGNPHLWEEYRYRKHARKGRLPLESWGIRDGLKGPLAVPGVYKVTLVRGDKTYTQELIVKKDPNTTGNMESIRTQTALALKIRDSLNRVIFDINRIEILRKQMLDLGDTLRESVNGKGTGDVPTGEVLKALEELELQFRNLEGRYFQATLAEGDLKSFRAPVQLYSRLALLGGDVAEGSADFSPTDQQFEVFEELNQELTDARHRLQGLLEKELPAFNRLLQQKGFSGITCPVHGSSSDLVF